MRYFISILFPFLLCIAGLYFACCFLIPPISDVVWVADLYKRKEQMLVNDHSKQRIIIVGGSDALYQVSAEQIEKATGIKTYNFGTHAQLGWEELLDKALPYVRKNDIVIYIANIYGMQRPQPSELLVKFTRYTQPLAFIDRPVAEWPEYVGANIVDDAVRSLYDGKARASARVDASLLNAFGDRTDSIVGPGYRFAQTMRSPGPVPPFKPPVAAFGYLKRFNNIVERRGATLLVSWQGVLFDPIFETKDQQQNLQLIEAAALQWGFKTLNYPIETKFSLQEIFNGPQHPNSIGRQRYTAQIIDRLPPSILSTQK